MAGINVQGPVPSSAKHLMRRSTVVDLLNTGTTRDYANDRVTVLSSAYATKTYVDSQDDLYVTPAQVDTADALNLPLTAKGVPNGVATLGTETPDPKVPLAQCPNFGVGIFKGPYGATTQITTDTTTTSQVQLGTIDLGASGTGIRFKPLAYACAFVGQTANSRGVLELRIGDATQTTYASQTLIGQGSGRSAYNDYQSIPGVPAGSTTGLAFTAGLSPSTHWIVTLWLVSIGGGLVNVKTGNITTFSAYLLRTAL